MKESKKILNAALVDAVRRSDGKKVKESLRAGADANALVNKQGRTVLMDAAEKGIPKR